MSAEKTTGGGRGAQGEKEKKESFVLYVMLSSDQPHQKNGRGCTATVFDKKCQTKFLPHWDPWDPLALSRELLDCWHQNQI